VELTISPTGGVTTTTYNDSSEVATVTDPDGREEIFSYNAQNQVTQELWLSSVGGTVLDTLTYSYTPTGQLATAGDSGGEYTFTYDEFGNVSKVQDGYNDLTLTYSYDSDNNLTGITDSQGGVISSTFNGVDEMTATSINGSVCPSEF
jgi:YD repeat-containing protein